ncbi:MAG: protein kinase [Myxococcota bacterium]
MSTTEPLPATIGPYRVLQSIAKGGTGHVVEIEDPRTGEHLALKILMHRGASLARFFREYDAMIRLNHPNIIRVFHFGSHDGMPWQTMELVTGTPVQAYIMRKGRPGDPRRLQEVIRLGHDIAAALHHVHRRGLVHRDLKSANLLVLPDGRIKLIDFGSVRVLDGKRLTRDGDFVGTFAYASPEQLVAAPVDGRSDLYSLGVLLYRLCTGRRPFEHDDPTTLARMHLREPPVPPQDLYPTISDDLNQLILQLLAKRRDKRPPTGKHVARAFEKMAGGPIVLPGTLEIEATANRLVGREPQQQAIRAFLAHEAPGSLALLEGLEGSGRHTLLHALAADARAAGWLTYRCVLSPGKDVVSVVLLLRQIFEAIPDMDTPSLRRARELLELLAKAVDIRSAQRREALQQAGAILLRATVTQQDRRALVVIEGLHHAGPVVLDWLDEVKVGLAKSNTGVQFAAGVDPASDRRHLPIRTRFEDDLWVSLPALDSHKVGLLTGALLHRRPPPPFVAAQIHQASGGLPAYVEHVVSELVDQGLLREQGDDPNRLEWARHTNLIIPVPAEARERVMEQLRPLPTLHRRALVVLATLDEGAQVRDLAAGLGWVPDEITMVLEDLQQRGWLESGSLGPNDPVVWRQRLAREVVREQAPPSRSRVTERLLSVALVGERRSQAQVELLSAVGRVDDAIDSAIHQARVHLLAGRPASALRVVTPAISEVRAARNTPRQNLADLFLLHTKAMIETRPVDPELHLSLKRAQSLGTGDAFRAEVSLVKATLQRRIGHLGNYRKELAEAWTASQHSEDALPVAVEVAVELGLSHLRAGALRVAQRWFQQAQRAASSQTDPRLVATAEAGLAHLRFHRGELDAAEVAALAAIELFDKLGDAEGLALAMPVWAATLREQARFSAAIDMISHALPTFRRQENPSPYVHLLVSQAWLEVELCRLGRAQECIDELAAAVSPGERLVLRVQARLVHGRILLASDQLRQAARVLGDVCNVANQAGLVLIAEHARALLAETLWLAGQQDEARRLFHQAIKRVRETRDKATLLQVCRSRGRVAAEVANPEDLFEPVREVLEREPAELTRLEWLVATGKHCVALELESGSAWREAHDLLRDVSVHLTDIDRSALKVHPWARLVRSHLDQGDAEIL